MAVATTEILPLERLEPANLVPAPPSLREAYEAEAKALLKSGYFDRFRIPKKRRNDQGEWIIEYTVSEEQAVINMTTVMLYGRELHLAPIQSLQHIYIVNGLPGLDFAILQAMVRWNGRGFVAMWPVSSSQTEATYHIERHDGPVPQVYDATFTIEDAKRLHLGWRKSYKTDKWEEIADSPWTTQREVMLLRRAGTKGMREMLSDLTQGFYSLDEVGIKVRVDGDHEVPVLTETGEPVIERLVISEEEAEAEDFQEAEFVPDEKPMFNDDRPATSAEVREYALKVRQFCEEHGHERAAVNIWLGDRMERMGFKELSEATAMQLEVLHDALLREYT